MIADNRLSEIASWDDRLLAEQLKELSLLGLDFSLEITGFEMGEIDLRIASLKDVPEQADDLADVAPEVVGASGHRAWRSMAGSALGAVRQRPRHRGFARIDGR